MSALRPATTPLHDERGFTLMELLITLFLSSMVMVSIMAAMISSTSYFHDRRVKGEADERARVVLDMMAFDIRMAGSGMPINQKDFRIADAALGTATYPILLDAAEDFITFRLNERGIQTMTTTELVPSSINRTFSVLSTDDLEEGDIIYISNVTGGGDPTETNSNIDGLRGEIETISGSQITIADSFVASAGATFGIGSYVHRVSEVSYDSAADITRNDGTGAVTLIPRSSFTLTYLNAAGAAMTLPLTDTDIRDDLMRIRIRVSVDGDRPLKAGVAYTAVAEQDVFLRNILLSRP